MNTKFSWNQQIFQLSLVGRGPLTVAIEHGDDRHEITLASQFESRDHGTIMLAGRPCPYFISSEKRGVWVTLAGRTYFFERVKNQASHQEPYHANFEAPMPGKVIDVCIEPGDAVTKGQVLVIMEAMKMEHRMEAPTPGTVTAIHCVPGDLVDHGFNLLDFEPEEEN